jgi:site-specific recombinase XerD
MKMKQSTKNQRTIWKTQDMHLATWMEAFLIDRKAQGLAKGTIMFYQQKLEYFNQYCNAHLVTEIPQVSPHFLREYLLWLEELGHNPGGVHACYRAIKTFLYWWEDEIEPVDWVNPIRKVKPPRNPIPPLLPIKLAEVEALLETCDSTELGRRDKAIILCLLDTGVRASELCNMKLDDLDRTLQSVLIRSGKGRKPRTVFLGKKTRKSIRQYLRTRKDDSAYLWATNTGTQLTYWGLRQIIRRRAEKANIPEPGLHDFRRAFALQCLRNGIDVYSLQKLMGHADLQVLQRYLAQTAEDISKAHRIGSPVDNSNL